MSGWLLQLVIGSTTFYTMPVPTGLYSQPQLSWSRPQCFPSWRTRRKRCCLDSPGRVQYLRFIVKVIGYRTWTSSAGKMNNGLNVANQHFLFGGFSTPSCTAVKDARAYPEAAGSAPASSPCLHQGMESSIFLCPCVMGSGFSQ